jgi:hypothetical protein
VTSAAISNVISLTHISCLSSTVATQLPLLSQTKAHMYLILRWLQVRISAFATPRLTILPPLERIRLVDVSHQIKQHIGNVKKCIQSTWRLIYNSVKRRNCILEKRTKNNCSHTWCTGLRRGKIYDCSDFRLPRFVLMHTSNHWKLLLFQFVTRHWKLGTVHCLLCHYVN